MLNVTSFDSVTGENRPKQTILDGAVNKFYPETFIKVNKINSPLNPWMTPGLLTSRKHEERLK